MGRPDKKEIALTMQFNMFDITGKNILVAGGRGLIGSAVVAALERQGATVYVSDPKDDSEYRSVSNLCGAYIFDGFVNCAYPVDSGGHLRFFLDSTMVMAKHLSSNQGGSIVNLASIYGVMGPDDRIYEGTTKHLPEHYAAAKGAIIAHSRILAVRYATESVRINCISPGGVIDTKNQPARFIEQYSHRVPMRRMATPEEVAGPVVFLVSDASVYITGQNIMVDGGLSAW